ncbi:MAG: PEP-CTERM sorting domain-containing protein [Verrucomicrobiaceae bacterium]
MKKTAHTLTGVAFAALSSISLSHAAVIAQDNFESYTAGSADATDFTSGTWSGGQRSEFDVVNSGAPAATLTGNYVEMKSRVNNFSFVNQDTATTQTVGTMSFDLVIPSAVGTNGYLRLSLQGDAGLFRHVDISGASNTGPEGKEVGGLSEDTVHRIDAVMNTTGSTINFGSESLAADSIAVYVDGTLAYTNTAANNGATLGRVGFWMTDEAAGAVKTMYMDNMVFQDEAIITAIPEPSSLALVGLGALGMLTRRRK